MTERVNCPSCGSRDETATHLKRCQRIHEVRAEATALGSSYGVPEVTTADLWAHLGHVASPEEATRIVRQVLDLGWRPVVGSDPKRLWTAPPPIATQEARAEVKAAVEEWFTDVSLDDLFAVKGWEAGATFDPDHCTACGDFLPCGESWLKETSPTTDASTAHVLPDERGPR